MPNIQFLYLYRDNSNYKNYGLVVFSNRSSIALNDIEFTIRSALIDQTWFYPVEWKLPCLYFDEWKDETDNLFHEFNGVLFTDEAPTENADMLEFINRIKTSRTLHG